MDKNTIIEQLYREHKDHVYNFIARMANDSELALDVTQQTFVKALSDKNLTQVENPKAYLFTIARNTLFNEFKRKKATSLDAIEEVSDFEAIDENEKVHDKTELHDIQAKVEKSIKRMPEKTKELMILRYTEDLSIKEISAITGRTISDVKVNLHRARIKFESSFTNEMYAKLAVSRDHCETLTTLLAPHDNNDIPEQQLQIVDKHIRKCKICSEDAEQLKRSRILFNLGALISAPYIFDKMMSDAMASEFNFLAANSNPANSSASTSTSTSTSLSKTLITKLISSKIALISTVIIVTGIISLILINSANKEDEPQIVNSTQTNPTPTGQNKTGTISIDPDATAMVSFKARQNKTGSYIFQGLKWDIYNTTNSRGTQKSNKPELVQSSTNAKFSAILESGYYLAKVSYQGKTIESTFIVQNDEALDIELHFSNKLNNATTNVTKLKLPTIHIRRLQTGDHEAKPLKVVWDLCVTGINIYKESRAKYPEMWAMQEKSLKESSPNFNLDRGLAPEANWSTITQNYEDEYFSGDKYALYEKGSTYEVADDGSCKLVKTDYHRADVDDGKFAYTIDFIRKIAEKYKSKVVLEKEVQQMYKDIAKNNPFAMQAMGEMIGEAMLGKNDSTQRKQSLKAVNELNKLIKVAGTKTIAGESCEYTVLGVQTKTQICYWKTMHEYPSIVKHSITLETIVDLSSATSQFTGKSTTTAILFEKDLSIADSIFTAPNNMRIDDSGLNY
ncbi:hypothetical protein MNBD_GAMMA22-2397 [hydrothermal vent metagenome]|uniref:RNA polymerase sigma factor n=1 Tax=hydrothermal vent metagenome TaxID=652676 RepID=A0A3B0ZVR2_9ZZZZ